MIPVVILIDFNRNNDYIPTAQTMPRRHKNLLPVEHVLSHSVFKPIIKHFAVSSTLFINTLLYLKSSRNRIRLVFVYSAINLKRS